MLICWFESGITPVSGYSVSWAEDGIEPRFRQGFKGPSSRPHRVRSFAGVETRREFERRPSSAEEESGRASGSQLSDDPQENGQDCGQGTFSQKTHFVLFYQEIENLRST